MRQRDERGSVTVWGVLIALILTLVIGITVDLTGQVNAQQRAHDLAQQAGRTAANQVQASQIMRGQSPQIDTAAARTAAAAYLDAAGVEGSVSITGPTTLSVHVTIVYQPKFLGTAGIGPKTVSGDAAILLSRVVNGAPDEPTASSPPSGRIRRLRRAAGPARGAAGRATGPRLGADALRPGRLVGGAHHAG